MFNVISIILGFLTGILTQAGLSVIIRRIFLNRLNVRYEKHFLFIEPTLNAKFNKMSRKDMAAYRLLKFVPTTILSAVLLLVCTYINLVTVTFAIGMLFASVINVREIRNVIEMKKVYEKYSKYPGYNGYNVDTDIVKVFGAKNKIYREHLENNVKRLFYEKNYNFIANAYIDEDTNEVFYTFVDTPAYIYKRVIKCNI